MNNSIFMLAYYLFKVIYFSKFSKYSFNTLKEFLLEMFKFYSARCLATPEDYYSYLSEKILYADDKTFKCCRSYIKFCKGIIDC